MKMNKLTLLCVEDDIEALEDVEYLLKRYFHKIYTAIDGEEALHKYNKYNPDMIILDINIPKINGLDVALQIRQLNKKIPIIFLTAHSEKDKLLKAIDLKVSSYIIKPFKIAELVNVIFKVIKEIDVKSSKLQLLNDFVWDKETYELFYKNVQINLTKNEVLLIKLLLRNRTRFLLVTDILVDIGIGNNDFNGNSIVQLISRFKKKIKNKIKNDKFFIENNYGSGYRIK